MSEPSTIERHLREAASQFEAVFDRPPTHIATAPGRVNLIGEHTDYNAGFVLPMAIERQTLVLAARRSDRTACLASSAFEGRANISLDAPIKPGEPRWANYLRGVIAGYQSAQFHLDGLDALVHSNVPAGGGLSSSASIEVAAATLIEALAGPKHSPLEPIQKALLCQRAEHEFAGMPCGIMDPLVITLARADHALLIDCRSLAVDPVPLSDSNIAVLIIDSNRTHELVGGEYAQRREQCEHAAQVIGLPALRDATEAQLTRHRAEMDKVSFFRARHVIRENQRTLDAAKALGDRDWSTVGRLMFASHDSLRDDFEVSTPELDTLVEIAQEHADQAGATGQASDPPVHGGRLIGSRMTGGGFGGCTVSLVHADRAETLAQSITHAYHQRTGITPTAFITRPAEGTRTIRG